AILACYTVAALAVRPFSGYLLDTFARKPLYLLAFSVFTLIFGGYIVTGTVLMFIALRIVHGFSFGTVTVAGNTIVIDITPSSRRGEAVGYYGLANNIAMSLGPMTGLFMHDHVSFDTIFITALCCCLAGLICASLIRTPKKQPMPRAALSLDRFILLKGIPLGIDLLLLSIPYGMTTTYVAMYAKHIGITGGTGLFFTCMAVGLAISRLFSGKQVDHGHITEVIHIAFYPVILCFLSLFFCERVASVSVHAASLMLYATALVLGAGFGTMFPAFNTMFVNLGRHDQRGTATSTYLTSWDIGIGIGLVLGGIIGEHSSFSYAYLMGAGLSLISLLGFVFYASPHFHRNRVE
ncbi:MAG TPA: MFS transporter, partial [Candidatus Coprenecus stercoravium]|nr:MFS transporter [Candidatus Coprenecus stercoravium]